MANRRKELEATLLKFYSQPSARVSLELFITIIVIMFFAVFAIRPTLLTMSDLIKEIEDKRALDQALTEKVAALSTGQTEYLNFQPKIGTLEKALPSDPRLIDSLKLIEKIASDRRLAIVSIGIPEPPQISTASAEVMPERQNLNFAVTVAGDYVTIREFVNDLQNAKRIMIVESIIFRIDETDGEILKAQITINMPYYGASPWAARVSAKNSSLFRIIRNYWRFSCSRWSRSSSGSRSALSRLKELKLLSLSYKNWPPLSTPTSQTKSFSKLTRDASTATRTYCHSQFTLFVTKIT